MQKNRTAYITHIKKIVDKNPHLTDHVYNMILCDPDEFFVQLELMMDEINDKDSFVELMKIIKKCGSHFVPNNLIKKVNNKANQFIDQTENDKL